MLKKLVPLLLVSSISQAADSVRIYNWSDYIAPDTMKEFQKATGIKAHYDVYDSNETLDAKLSAGRSGYDVVFPSDHYMARQIQRGALKELDKSRIPNWKNINPTLLKALEVNDPGNKHGFPYLWGTTGIGYNVDKVRELLGDATVMDSWDSIFKPENLSKLAQCGVAVLDNGPELLPITLHYLSLPHHSKNLDDYKLAEEKLLEVRKNVRYFHSSKYIGDLANGDICVAVGFSGDILQAANRAIEAKNGINIEYSIPKEGVPIWFDMVTMPADSGNEEAGYAFMNYLLQPEVIAKITNYVQYANAIPSADSLVDKAVLDDRRIYPAAEQMNTFYSLEAMPMDIDRVRTRIWTKVKSGL